MKKTEDANKKNCKTGSSEQEHGIPLETCDEAPVQKQAGDRRTDLL